MALGSPPNAEICFPIHLNATRWSIKPLLAGNPASRRACVSRNPWIPRR